MNQLEQIRFHLTKYGSISSWDAIQTYRITRLSQFILLLRQEGYQIESEWQHNETKRWVKYVLISVPTEVKTVVEPNGQHCLI